MEINCVQLGHLVEMGLKMLEKIVAFTFHLGFVGWCMKAEIG